MPTVAQPPVPTVARPVCVYIEGLFFIFPFLPFLYRRYYHNAWSWTANSNKTTTISSESGRSPRKIAANTRRSPGPVSIAGFVPPTLFALSKSRRGVASEAQKQARAGMLPAGAVWWMARSANAAMMALHLSGVPFLKPWQPQPLEPWEGPFADPHQRLPQEPGVAAERKATLRAWRERQRVRKAAKLAAERDDAAGADIAA